MTVRYGRGPTAARGAPGGARSGMRSATPARVIDERRDIGRTGRAGRKGVDVTFVEPREQRLVRNIERLMKRRIEIERVPTVADLRARRMELLGASLAEALLRDDLDRYRAVVEPLAGEYDPFEIPLAAASLADDAAGASGTRPMSRTSSCVRRNRRVGTSRIAGSPGRRPVAATGGVGQAGAAARTGTGIGMGMGSLGCSSAAGSSSGSGRPTSSAQSRTRSESATGPSALSRSPTGSLWSRCRPKRPMTSSARSRRASAVGGSRSGGIATRGAERRAAFSWGERIGLLSG